MASEMRRTVARLPKSPKSAGAMWFMEYTLVAQGEMSTPPSIVIPAKLAPWLIPPRPQQSSNAAWNCGSPRCPKVKDSGVGTKVTQSSSIWETMKFPNVNIIPSPGTKMWQASSNRCHPREVASTTVSAWVWWAPTNLATTDVSCPTASSSAKCAIAKSDQRLLDEPSLPLEGWAKTWSIFFFKKLRSLLLKDAVALQLFHSTWDLPPRRTWEVQKEKVDLWIPDWPRWKKKSKNQQTNRIQKKIKKKKQSKKKQSNRIQ